MVSVETNNHWENACMDGDSTFGDEPLDDDGIREIEQQLIDGHTYPCAIDMWNLRATWEGEQMIKMPLQSRRWLYGRRFLRRSYMLGRRDGTTLIAVMLN
jgi:hypothetical protein